MKSVEQVFQQMRDGFAGHSEGGYACGSLHLRDDSEIRLDGTFRFGDLPIPHSPAALCADERT